MRKQKERGSALVIALMAMVIMSLLASAFLIMTSFERESSFNEAVNVTHLYQADALIEEYIHQLLNDEDSDGDDYPDIYAKVFGVGAYDSAQVVTIDTTNAEGDSLVISLRRTPPYADSDKIFDDTSMFSSKATVGDENITGRPLVMDIDSDGVIDILVGTDGGKIRRFNYVFEIPSGETVPRWMVKEGAEYANLGGSIYGELAVDDIDRDCDLELIACNDEGKLYCFDLATGAEIWNTTIGSDNPFCWQPTIGNLDRDDSLEVAFSTTVGIALIEADGTTKTVIPWPDINGSLTDGDTLGYTNGKALIVDVNSGVGMDKRAEVIVTDGLFCYCFNELGGNWGPLPRWRYPMGVKMDDNTGAIISIVPVSPKSVSAFWVPQPGACDIDRDGDMEIIITASEGGSNDDNDFAITILDDRNREVDEATVNNVDVNFDGSGVSNDVVPDDVRINLANYIAVDADKIQAYRPVSSTPVFTNRGIMSNITCANPIARDSTLVSCGDINRDSIPDIFIQNQAGQFFIINALANQVTLTNPSDQSLTHVDTSGAYTPQGSYSFIDFEDDGTGTADFPCNSPIVPGVSGPATFYNLDDDAELEVVYGTMYEGGQAYFMVLDNNFYTESMLDYPEFYERLAIKSDEGSSNIPSFMGGVVLADLNDDGFMEIIAGSASFDGGSGGALYGNPKSSNGPQYLFVHSLKGMNLPKCMISAYVKSPDGSMRSLEATVRVQVDMVDSTRVNFEIMSWVER